MLAAPAAADERLAAEVERTNIWVNTDQYTPPIYEVTDASKPCVTDVRHRHIDGSIMPELEQRWRRAPLPCSILPSGGSDAEAVVMNRTGEGLDYYEFWILRREGRDWAAAWGGAANDRAFRWWDGTRAWNDPAGQFGTQASGIAFVPGVVRVAELQAGRIDHPVQLVVPQACRTWRAPATRTDNEAGGKHCFEYGTRYELPDDVDISGLPRLARTIAQAAKDHYLVVTDQSGSTLAIRAENWRRPGAQWGEENPYPNAFGCDGRAENGRALRPGQEEYDCYPDKRNLFRDFPWRELRELPRADGGAHSAKVAAASAAIINASPAN